MSDIKIKKIVNLLAFYAIALFGFTLILDWIGLFGDLSGSIKEIAGIVAFSITAVYAFFYARSKQKLVYIIIYVIAVMLLLLRYVWPVLTNL